MVMNIARGYEPVAKLDTNVMASREALSKMGFDGSEIDKKDVVAKARKHFEKWSKELAELTKKGQGEYDKSNAAFSEFPICDICGNPTVLSGVKLTTPEQETHIPPDWAPFALSRFGSAGHGNYRAYVLIPPGIVIDYQTRKVYVVCGNCHVVLGLKATESGILIHNETKGTGHGFVDLDRVERLIQTYKTHKSSGYRIDCLIDFDVAVHIDDLWEKQPKVNP